MKLFWSSKVKIKEAAAFSIPTGIIQKAHFLTMASCQVSSAWQMFAEALFKSWRTCDKWQCALQCGSFYLAGTRRLCENTILPCCWGSARVAITPALQIADLKAAIHFFFSASSSDDEQLFTHRMWPKKKNPTTFAAMVPSQGTFFYVSFTEIEKEVFSFSKSSSLFAAVWQALNLGPFRLSFISWKDEALSTATVSPGLIATAALYK